MAEWPAQEFKSIEDFWEAVGPMGYRMFYRTWVDTNPVQLRFGPVTVCHKIAGKPGWVQLKDQTGVTFQAHVRTLLNCASTMFTDECHARSYTDQVNYILRQRSR